MSRTAGSLAPDANDPIARPDELVRAALGVDPARAPATPEDRVSARAASPGPDPGGAVPGTGTLSGVAAVPGVGTLLGAVAVPGAVVLLGAAFLVLGGVLSIARGFLPGFLASTAFWSAAALTVTGRPGIGATLVLVALVSLAVVASVHGRERDGSAVASPQRVFGSAVPFLAGAVLAVASVAYAIHSVDAAPVFPGSTLSLLSPSPSFAAFPLLPLLLSTGFGLLGGAAVARIGSPRAAGTALAFALALAVHLGGETLSLSSIDVRLAHRVAGLVPGSGGVALAVPVALLRLVWPLVAVLVGYLLVRRRAGRAADGIAPIAFAVAFATCQLGAIAVYALCLASAVEPATTGLPLAAAGLGGLLREGVTTCLVFGVLVLAATDRRTDPDRSDPIRSDPDRFERGQGVTSCPAVVTLAVGIDRERGAHHRQHVRSGSGAAPAVPNDVDAMPCVRPGD